VVDPGAGATNDVDNQLSLVAVLADPIRRMLYRYVLEQGEPVSRDQAAHATAVARHVAKFHLDRLETEGLLKVEYHRPAGRSGPGAGRPTKFYRSSGTEIAVSLPQRRYDLAGRVLAGAVSAAQRGAPLDEALADAAFGAGRALVVDDHLEAASVDGGCALNRIGAVLTECGYQPKTGVGRLALTNCPFHELARDYPELACGLNLDLIRGMIDALGEPALQAELEPMPGGCCVVVSQPEAG
jgi:predicted ArsR family transcriptional regulator